MSNLFQIQKEYLELNDQIMQLEGEITPEVSEALAINKGELEVKGQGYAYVIKKNDADCDIIDAEIKRLQNIKRVINNATERLKEYLEAAMNIYEIPEIKTPLIKINFRKSSAVEITDLELIPSEFIKTEVIRTPDKLGIKKAIQDGLFVAGASLSERKSLQIK